MIKNSAVSSLLVVILLSAVTRPAAAAATPPPRLMENLGRGVVAIRQADGKIFIAWRMLGTDADDIAFNVYRGGVGAAAGEPVKLNAQPIRDVTFFIDGDAKAAQAASYFVRPIIGGKEQP